MATKYHSFNLFMDEVVKAANNQVNLEELFALNSGDVIKIISTILVNSGWPGFIAVVFLLLLGPIAFLASSITFVSTPPGLVIFLIFGSATILTLKTLYQNRELPIAVKEVGEEFMPKWRIVEGNTEKVDDLLYDAVKSLINKAAEKQKNLGRI
jgi:membrane protein implicated in regulation of membrane protease activity